MEGLKGLSGVITSPRGLGSLFGDGDDGVTRNCTGIMLSNQCGITGICNLCTSEFNKTITVGKGMIVQLEFTDMQLGHNPRDMGCIAGCGCISDQLTVTDNDGTILWHKTCASEPPPIITSSTNTIHISFTNGARRFKSTWNATWKAVDPGALQ